MKKLIKINKKSNYLAFFAIFSVFFALFSQFLLLFNCKNILSETEYYYTYNVEHLFTHCLIAYPEIAFNKNSYMCEHYKSDCITSKEFIRILDGLYKNSYVLINLTDCFEVINGTATKKKVKIPKGKKALVLSFDDVNYDHKKMGLGMVDKIIVDEKGELASETMIGEFKDVRYDLEFIPILEQFVKKHPDFSCNGAKGTLNLTGYDGILGYRTSHSNTKNRDEEIKKAKKVIGILKKNGWQFASHSYGHYHMNKISLTDFKQEIDLWKNEVESIVGKTSVYVYPYGEWQVFSNGEISPKHQLLIDAGFKLFCGVGMKTFYSYLPNKNNNKVLFMDRKCVDGNTISSYRAELYPFFNPITVLDSARNI